MADDGWHLTHLGLPAIHAGGIGGAGVRIAVIDTGVVSEHPDLDASRITVRDFRGAGFDGVDRNGHGTGMVGVLIGAQGAVCPDAEIISVKVALGTGPASVPDLITGIELALEEAVDLVSISMGTTTLSPVLRDQIALITDAGVPVIAAAEDSDSVLPLYPAFFPSAIAVTAAGEDDELLFEVPTWVDLASPGHEIATLDVEGRTLQDGTSPAAAIVSGVCALVLGLADTIERRRALGRRLIASLTGGQASGRPVPSIDPARLLEAASDWLASPLIS
jgi:thermitase